MALRDLILLVLSNLVYCAVSNAANVKSRKFSDRQPSTTVKTTVLPEKRICIFNEDEMIRKLQSDNDDYNVDISKINCTDYNEIEIQKTQISELEQWKTQVVIACTITAAVEIFIAIIIVLYWKQIRWSLRKLQCPCDETSRRQRTERGVRRRREREEQRRLRHLVVTTTQNAINATARSDLNTHIFQATDSGGAETMQLHKPLNQSDVHSISKQHSSKGVRLKLKNKKLFASTPRNSHAIPMLQIQQHDQSFQLQQLGNRSLIEEIEPVASTSYAQYSSPAASNTQFDWPRNKHLTHARVISTSCSDSDSDFDCNEITVEVHR